MSVYRLLLLGATFFLVALIPIFDLALGIFFSGLLAYAVLSLVDLLFGKKPK